MLKYVAMAAGSKAFSLSNGTKWAYRKAGNVALNRIRVSEDLPERYLDRAHWLVRTMEKYDILADGGHIIELGTGYMHWESSVLRVFYDFEATLYDVADCRLFGSLKHYLTGLRREIGTFEEFVGAQRVARARELLDKALAVESFEEYYALMGFRYVVDPSGMLAGVGRDYRLAVSSDVFEHVPAATMPAYLARLLEILEPGGYSVHQIDLVDHFYYFDTTTSPKQYYRYDDRAWQRWFDSDVQYINRIQRPEWVQLWDGAGFETVELQDVSEPLAPITLAPQYQGLTQAERECMQFRIVHRRPE